MSWSVRLQDERGKPVSSGDAGIEFEAIPTDGNFKLLRYIDPYSDTYFNQVQMDDFLTDWNSLRLTGDPFEQWTLVRDMAIRCKNEPHLYLRFIGD